MIACFLGIVQNGSFAMLVNKLCAFDFHSRLENTASDVFAPCVDRSPYKTSQQKKEKERCEFSAVSARGPASLIGYLSEPAVLST